MGGLSVPGKAERAISTVQVEWPRSVGGRLEDKEALTVPSNQIRRELRIFIRSGTRGVASGPISFAGARIDTAPRHPPKVVEDDETGPPLEHLSQNKWRNVSTMNVSEQNQIGFMFSDMFCQFRRVVALAARGQHGSISEGDRRNLASGAAQCFG
jgi:hypothetical protein